MDLRQEEEATSAKWNHVANKWDLLENKRYSWFMNNKQQSEWFSNIADALSWIIKHDEERV